MYTVEHLSNFTLPSLTVAILISLILEVTAPISEDVSNLMRPISRGNKALSQTPYNSVGICLRFFSSSALCSSSLANFHPSSGAGW